MKEQLKIYIEENLDKTKKSSNRLADFFKLKNLFFEEDYVESEKEESININDIDTFIKNNKSDYNDFQTTLFKMIDEKNLKDSDVYNKVHIDRRLFSKIRSDKNYHPSKETIILLGISLELNEVEIEELLDSASYSLPKNNHYDLIIRFCFINKIYNLKHINELLEQYNCKVFHY